MVGTPRLLVCGACEGTIHRKRRNRLPHAVLLGMLFAALWSTSNQATAADTQHESPFDIDDRVVCQTRIESIRWSHRIWPDVNHQPKPTLTQVLSEEHVRSRVIENLRMETALKELFGVVITEAMLQAELDRMARNTKAPDRLQELFNALDNDPVKIAECMARPFLVEQRLRHRYSWDDRFHGELDTQVEAALLKQNDPALRTDPVGRTERVIYLLRDGTSSITEPSSDDGAVEPVILSSEEYKHVEARVARLSAQSSRTAGLRETESAFIYEEVLSHTPKRLEVDQTVWRKKDFNTWWDENASRWSAIAPALVSIGQQLPRIAEGDVPDDFENPEFTPPDTWLVGRSLYGRVNHTAIWTGTEMIIWGGYSDDDTNTGDRYDPITDQWLEVNTYAAPTERRHQSAVWTGTEMIVWGGYDGTYLDTGGRYSPTTNDWAATSTTDAPDRRCYHTAVWTGSEMIVWGGQGNYNTGGRYDPATDLWEATSIVGAPSKRNNHKAVWTGDEMIVWGGLDGSDKKDTGGRYDPATDLWVPTSTTGAPIARYYHTAVWTGSEMIVWGGSTDVNPYQTNTGGRYDPATDLWVETSTTDAPALRIHHSAVWTGSEMIVWGGSDGGDPLNTGGRFDPATDLWVETSTTDAPSPRRSGTAVWTGSEMIAWGGSDGGDPLNTGGRYDPATDQWVATHLGYSPLERSGHTAVWTGSEMFVWGGSADSVRVNTGGRYDPVIDGWTPTTTANAPSARNGHTAVWTGTEVIVWGGYDNDYADTGGSYDPVLEGWVATNMTSPPSGRGHHTAVWTGTEMVVWGGEDNLGELNTGGRYDPVTNGWTATNSLDAPTERKEHTAIWTGTEMIVWGGEEAVSLDTGGRYLPSSDTWSSTDTDTAPIGRSEHTAVWTGSEMIIWGGWDQASSHLDSGGRYDPATDSWETTSTADAPSARINHTAVWTGWEMIVWGGSPYSVSLGLYYPYGDESRIFFDGFETGNRLRWADSLPY